MRITYGVYKHIISLVLPLTGLVTYSSVVHEELRKQQK